MATDLTPTLQTAYLAWRRHPTNPNAGPYKTGTVSELLAGDFILGPRAVVEPGGVGSLSGSNRTLTVKRLGQVYTISYPDTQQLIFQR